MPFPATYNKRDTEGLTLAELAVELNLEEDIGPVVEKASLYSQHISEYFLVVALGRRRVEVGLCDMDNGIA